MGRAGAVQVAKLKSKRDWFDAQHGFCWLCGTPMNFRFKSRDPFCATFDHLVPAKYGGTWAPENLLLAHSDCNYRRGHQREIFWLSPPRMEEPALEIVSHETCQVFSPHPNRCCKRRGREIRPERPSVHLPWTRQWMVDKGLLKP